MVAKTQPLPAAAQPTTPPFPFWMDEQATYQVHASLSHLECYLFIKNSLQLLVTLLCGDWNQSDSRSSTVRSHLKWITVYTSVQAFWTTGLLEYYLSAPGQNIVSFVGKMTAKHRKGKSNQKHEDNFFKNEVMESEVRGGANNYTLLLVLFLMIVIGGATGAWFCFQQHQSLTDLTDNLMGMQMKIVRLQSSHEEMRQSSSKVRN